MSINETQLKNYLKKEEAMNKNLVSLREKRDKKSREIQRISKKRNPTQNELSKFNRRQKEIVGLETDITKVLSDLEKNTKKINQYKSKLSREKQRETDRLMSQLQEQTTSNSKMYDEHIEFMEQINSATEILKNSNTAIEKMEYDVFLSHSSLDKDSHVSELSNELEERGLRVFEDTKVFKVGDSQIDQMNKGILNSKAVVLFISKNFFSSKWSQYEFKAFLNRHVKEDTLPLLPIWHNVTYEEVFEFNPFLADKFALSTEQYSITEIAKLLYEAIKNLK